MSQLRRCDQCGCTTTMNTPAIFYPEHWITILFRHQTLNDREVDCCSLKCAAAAVADAAMRATNGNIDVAARPS